MKRRNVHRVVADDGKQYFAVCVNCDDEVSKGHDFHFCCIKCQTIECLLVPINFSISKSNQVEGINCVILLFC